MYDAREMASGVVAYDRCKVLQAAVSLHLTDPFLDFSSLLHLFLRYSASFVHSLSNRTFLWSSGLDRIFLDLPYLFTPT